MAYIAFDLDATLGYFEVTNPMSILWSREFLDNPEQSGPNGKLKTTERLEKKLRRARRLFAEACVDDDTLRAMVLRPNIHALFDPIVKAWKQKKVKSVIVYSNTSHTPSMDFAIDMIEHLYKVKGLFNYAADHWHPLRTADRFKVAPGEYKEPLKTMETLQKLFKAATKSRANIPFEQILFVDDRDPLHDLETQIPRGLTYLVPTPFRPDLSDARRKRLLQAGLEALDKAKVLDDPEYLESAYCHRIAVYDINKQVPVRGFPDLLRYVAWRMTQVPHVKVRWIDDTMLLHGETAEFLKRAATFKAS